MVMVGMRKSDMAYDRIKAMFAEVRACAPDKKKKRKARPLLLSATEAGPNTPWVVVPLEGKNLEGSITYLDTTWVVLEHFSIVGLPDAGR